ncbi:hypothetical protein [Brevibacillus fulvus]|uniref:Uncharacterized protein n=1 Tax=Brevibacillus fulvus TaxID=1125967 RepID=A0A938XVF0_9BACL|nr:hypothetical protein [Brevibacillus fulvus]MBM7588686.1 hypothetical protein [Brevibacillus fulvus]
MTTHDDFDAKYHRFARPLEKAIIITTLVFLLLLVASEIMLQFEPLRSFLIETVRLEGVNRSL